MRSSAVFLFVSACAAAPVFAPASAPAPAPAPAAPAPAPAPAPSGPPPTGGSVLIGDIVSPKSFDPGPVLLSLQPEFLACYNQARIAVPALHGKLKLRIHVNEAGTVVGVDAEPGGKADDPALVGCLGDAMKATHFPKPGGSATVIAPLVFRP
jgi:hypothetical protein